MNIALIAVVTENVLIRVTMSQRKCQTLSQALCDEETEGVLHQRHLKRHLTKYHLSLSSS